MGSRRRPQVKTQKIWVPLTAFNSPLKNPQCCPSSKASAWLAQALQNHLLSSWALGSSALQNAQSCVRCTQDKWNTRFCRGKAREAKHEWFTAVRGSLALIRAQGQLPWLPGVAVLPKKSWHTLGGGADCSAWNQAVFSNSLWWEHHPLCRVPKTLPNHLLSEFLGAAQLRANGTKHTHARTKNEFCWTPGAKPSADVNGQQWH